MGLSADKTQRAQMGGAGTPLEGGPVKAFPERSEPMSLEDKTAPGEVTEEQQLADYKALFAAERNAITNFDTLSTQKKAELADKVRAVLKIYEPYLDKFEFKVDVYGERELERQIVPGCNYRERCVIELLKRGKDQDKFMPELAIVREPNGEVSFQEPVRQDSE